MLRQKKSKKTSRPVDNSVNSASGFRLDNKLNPLAIAAFVLALGSTIWQAVGYIQGSRTALLSPELVEIRRSPSGYTTVRAQMSYVNSGRSDYSTIVEKEAVAVRLQPQAATGQTEIKLAWQSFIRTTPEKETYTTEDDAHPFVVPGASAVSHQTTFFPRTQYCKGCPPFAHFIPWKTFLDQVRTAQRIDFQFTSSVFDNTPSLTVACSVYVDPSMHDYMAKNNYHSRPCVPTAP